VNLRKIAIATAGTVGADLANLVNEAALRAVRLGRKAVNQEDLLAAFELVIAGAEKKGSVLSEFEKKLVAYHEVGHAMVAYKQKNAEPVQKITIVPHTEGSLGYTLLMPEEDKTNLRTKEELMAKITVSMGGRAAEQVVLNTILADSFEQFANQLEPLEGEAVWQQVQCIIRDTMRSHGRVIYNGNNYSEQWVMEAQRRGLPILRTSVEAFATLTEQKNIELFDHHHIFSPKETAARYEIQLENYIHVLQIEASTMLEIAKRQIIPSVIGYSGKLAESLHRLEQCGLHPQRLENHLRMVSDSTESVMALTEELETALEQAQAQPQLYQCAQQMSRQVRQAMEKLREKCDALEMVVDRRDWPMPTYTDLLHRI